MPENESELTNARHDADRWLLKLVQQTVTSTLDERDRRYQERFEAQQHALGKVETTTEKRFESVNEFRKAMSDRDMLFMPRAEAMAQFISLADKLDGHNTADDATHLAMSKRFEELGKRVDNFEGTVSGSRTTLVTIAGFATFLVAVIVIGTFVFSGKTAQPQVVYVPVPAVPAANGSSK